LSEYEVIQKLGEGGFGEVDLAVHKETGEKVAIKFLKAALVGMFEPNILNIKATHQKSIQFLLKEKC
jgi:serine/threonine protein kinase